MERIIRELNLDIFAQATNFRRLWKLTEVRIITLPGKNQAKDIGWLQTAPRGDAIFLAQLFIDGPLQRRGLGTEVMHLLIDEAARAYRAVTLSVVQINPAVELYRRLGFRVIDRDSVKFHMRRDCGTLDTIQELKK